MARSRDADAVARLIRRLWVAAGALALLTLFLYVAYGTGVRLLELAWFNAFGFTFQALASAAVSYIAFGRYRVLGDSASYWVGVGFTGFGVALLMYVLVWPGLLPDGGSLVAGLSGTAAWFPVLAFLELWVCLQLAAWTGGRADSWRPVRNWLGAAAAIAALTACAGIVLIGAESRLPLLVQPDGSFAPLLKVVYLVQIALFAFGSWTAAHRARRLGDPLLAATAFFQIALLFIVLWVVIETERYGLWWYAARILFIVAGLSVLFAALAEHVQLLREEREKTRALAAAEAKLQENYALMNEANVRLQQQDHRKDQFLATLAHELRNPLAPIQTAVDILKLSPGDGAATLRVLPILERQLAHLKRLVDDLLDVSRITRGKITLASGAVDLGRVVRDVVEATVPGARRNIHLDIAHEPLMVQGDEVRVRQIIGNILDNAVKYTPETGNVWISADREGGDAVIRVRDDGIGIAPDLLDRVFDAFVQADSAQGLGLGLALVRQLVEMHGGRVDVQSGGAGRGSEFTVRLPASRPSDREVLARSDNGASRANGCSRILVVDDNRDAADGLRMLLELKGQVVESASDGPSALRAVERSLPDIVFLDIGLPGIGGLEVARRIRAMPRGHAVRLIAVTGWGQDEDKARSRDAGFDDHLTKPVDAAKLDAVLASLSSCTVGAGS